MEERPFGLAVMPLKNYNDAPDLLILISVTYQLMSMIQAYGHYFGYPDYLKTVGLQAICKDLTIRVDKTGEFNISLVCQELAL